MGENKRGYAVMRLVIFHPNVTSEILEEQAGSPDPYVLGDIAGNKKTPQRILVDLLASIGESSYSYLIGWGLSQNTAAPVNILEALANAPQSIYPA